MNCSHAGNTRPTDTDDDYRLKGRATKTAATDAARSLRLHVLWTYAAFRLRDRSDPIATIARLYLWDPAKSRRVRL